VSSLTGYGNIDKELIGKVSQIKTSTIDESKPRSISLLQKFLVLVLILTIFSASLSLLLAVLKSNEFYR